MEGRAPRERSRREWVLGLLALLGVVLLWVGAGELSNFIFLDFDFDKPLFVTYLSTVMFSLYLFGFVLRSWRADADWSNFAPRRMWHLIRHTCAVPSCWCCGRRSSTADDGEVLDSDQSAFEKRIRRRMGRSSTDMAQDAVGDDDEDGGDLRPLIARDRSSELQSAPLGPSDDTLAPTAAVAATAPATSADSAPAVALSDSAALRSDAEPSGLSADRAVTLPDPSTETFEAAAAAAAAESDSSRTEPMSVAQTFALSLLFCPLWFAANYTYNVSLALTSVASSTILSATSSFFTLLLGLALRSESVSLWKLLAVLLTIGGAVLVGLQAGRAGETVFGDAMALASAVGYAFYSVLLQRAAGEDSRLRAPMFFGFVGAVCLLLLWPLFPVWHGAGWERFAWPAGPVWGALAVNALMGTVLSDLLWVRAVLLTSPTVATVGLSLTIPVAMVADALLRGRRFPAPYAVGAVLVVLGFVLVTLADRISARVRPAVDRSCGGRVARCL